MINNIFYIYQIILLLIIIASIIRKVSKIGKDKKIKNLFLTNSFLFY